MDLLLELTYVLLSLLSFLAGRYARLPNKATGPPMRHSEVSRPVFPRFPRFLELPPEIRLMIWEEAVPKIHNRIPVSVACDCRIDGTSCGRLVFRVLFREEQLAKRHTVRSLLMACYEARQTALKHFPDTLETINGYLPVNFENEIVFLSSSDPLRIASALFTRRARVMMSPVAKSGVKKIAIGPQAFSGLWRVMPHLSFADFLTCMPDLEVLELVGFHAEDWARVMDRSNQAADSWIWSLPGSPQEGLRELQRLKDCVSEAVLREPDYYTRERLEALTLRLSRVGPYYFYRRARIRRHTII
ncbi:hypothetical protein GQ53DRAFT_805957 [Thozetella sp. PMI_491]|nr:hypothetical protein GQ53DRAFT_805957 [Thozetella sp. PMI_491]